MVKILRNLFINLKVEAQEYKEHIKNDDYNSFKSPISFDFYGTKSEYKLFKKIIDKIKWEYEDAISKYINYKIKIEVVNGVYRKNKATSLFIIKGVNYI